MNLKNKFKIETKKDIFLVIDRDSSEENIQVLPNFLPRRFGTRFHRLRTRFPRFVTRSLSRKEKQRKTSGPDQGFQLVH